MDLSGNMAKKQNKEVHKTSELDHLNHLPIFGNKKSLLGFLFCLCWALFIKLVFKFYIRLQVKGDFKKIYKKYPRLLVISNHASHLDAISISAAIPFKHWKNLYISVARDYWFSTPFFKFFSKYCLKAVPIDRKEQWLASVQVCVDLLEKLDRIWLILFPEGTRSKDGYIHNFKGGVSLFSKKTKTPILFLYIEGNRELMPKGHRPRPGKLVIHVGPVSSPASVKKIGEDYKNWVLSINKAAYPR